jgi:hypothetical protein
MLSSTAVFAGNGNDTLWPKHSLRLEIAGKALVGVGITYEFAWRNPKKTKHPRAFNSLEINASYPLIEEMITSAAINRNWYLGAKRKWTMTCGIGAAAMICFSPTPKELRQYYDEHPEYGRGRYVYPVEPWLLGNISCRYRFNRMFVQGSITPFLYYDRAYNYTFVGGPWAGVSVGIRLGDGEKRKLKPTSAIESSDENNPDTE